MRRFPRRPSLRAGFALALWSAASTLPALALVHPGDQLQVTVYNHPDLSQKVTVDASESISLPLAGRIDVRGLETVGIAQRIETALNPYFKSPAAVAVLLAGRPASLFVSGGPGGVLKYEPGETLAGAIASVSTADGAPVDAGGGLRGLERSRIDLRNVGVERDGARLGTYDVLQLSARGESGPQLQPGDTIALVDKPHVVRVLGDVVAPGAAFVTEDESLTDAIRQAGGVRETAASTDITLVRGGVTRSVALGDPELREPAQDGDVLTIPTAPRISVTGFVAKPGPITLKNNFTLLSALYEAGGPAKYADLSKIVVVHGSTQSKLDLTALKKGDISQNPKLADGDLVFVPEGHKVDFGAVFQSLTPLLFLLPRL